MDGEWPHTGRTLAAAQKQRKKRTTHHKQHHDNGRRMAAEWSQMVATQKLETNTNTNRKKQPSPRLRLSHKSNVKNELRNHQQHHENGRRMAAQWSQMVAAQNIKTKTNTHRKNNRALDTSTEPDPNTFFINSQQGTQHFSFVQKHICPESRLWPRTCSSQCHASMVTSRSGSDIIDLPAVFQFASQLIESNQIKAACHRAT